MKSQQHQIRLQHHCQSPPPNSSPTGNPTTSSSCVFDGKTYKNDETLVVYPSSTNVGGPQTFNSFSSCYTGAEFGICKNGVIKELNYVSANLNLSGKHSSCVQQSSAGACRIIGLDQNNETFGIQIMSVPATSDINQAGSYFLYGVQNSVSFSARLTEAPTIVKNLGDLFIDSLNTFEFPQNKFEILKGMTSESTIAGLFEKVGELKISSSPYQGQPFTNYSYKTWYDTEIFIGYGLGSSKMAALSEMKQKNRKVSCGVIPSAKPKCAGGTMKYGTCTFNYPATEDKTSIDVVDQKYTDVHLTGTCSGQTWIDVNPFDPSNLCKAYCPAGTHKEGSYCSFQYSDGWPGGGVVKSTTVTPSGLTSTLEGQCAKDASGAAFWDSSTFKFTNADSCWEYCDAVAGYIFSGTTPDFSFCAVDLPRSRLGTVTTLKDVGVLNTGGSVKVTCVKDPATLKHVWVPSNADDGSSAKCRL